MKNSKSLVLRARLIELMLALPLVAVAQSASRPSATKIEDYIKQSALVGFEWVDQPLNRVLLLHNNRTTCAIRFLSYRRAKDGRPPTSFDTGDASQFAVYEVAELTFNGSEMLIGAVIRRELDYRGLRGLGRLAFGVGDSDIRCGREKYSWLFPTGLLLKRDQSGVSVAPTNWTSFNDVRFDNPKLRWYQRDPHLQRPFIVIATEELPS